MLGLWKSKKRREEEKKTDAAKLIVDDVIGASDWKESKIGYITGLSSVGKVAGNVASSLAQSVGRVGLTFKLITKQEDDLPSLPDVDEGNYDGKLRFRAAMRLHNVREKDFARALSNTRRSTFFYGALFSGALAWLMIGWLARGHMPVTTLGLHLAPLPVFGALCFKAAYTNWLFRNQSLENPKAFIASRDWMPKA